MQTYLSGNPAIDHNLYVEDDLVWQANYTSGLRILDFTEEGLRAGEFEEVGFFDVFPAGDPTVFGGAWTAYPHFPSGTVVVNSFDTGMFVLRTDLSEPDPVDGDGGNGGQGEPEDTTLVAAEAADRPLPVTGGGASALGLLALAGAGVARRRRVV